MAVYLSSVLILRPKKAQVPRNTEAEVRETDCTRLGDALTAINTTPAARGRIAQKELFWLPKCAKHYITVTWQKAKDAAQAIIDLKQYELDSDYENLFKLSGIDSKEIILADQRLESVFGLALSVKCIIMMMQDGLQLFLLKIW